MGQLNMFNDIQDTKKSTMIDVKNKKAKESTKYKVYHVEFKEISYNNLEELFFGFNDIRAITFSYDIKFISKIIKMFDYGEIILGGRFMTRRDDKLHELTAEAYLLAENMGLSELAADSVRKEKKIVEMMKEGALLIRSPKYIIDHRKIYLLKADDGRTRVIKGSANMTSGAWSGNQMESYEIDDTYEAYEAYVEDFDTAWQMADDIPEDVVAINKTNSPEKDIPIIKKALKTQKAILLEEPKSSAEIYEKIKYAIDANKIIEKNKKLVSNIKAKPKNGYIEIMPNLLKKISTNAKRLKRKEIIVKEIVKNYPRLTFNFDNNEAFLDDKPLDLNPEEKEVRNDIELLFEAFDNYKKDFVGEVDKVRTSHYKLLNILFSSPFHAKLRCVADIQNIPTSSLPLYTLLASKSSNTGKSFMTEFILKLMTGKQLKAFSAKTAPTKEIDKMHNDFKGVPIFVDEIDSRYYSRLKEKIKNSHQCEIAQREEQPLFIFASNDLIDPEEPERKRMPFLRYNAGLKTDIDPLSYDGISKNIKVKATNALYREYLRRMIKKVDELVDYMIESKDIANNYYPDMMQISSRTLISIFEDFNYALPDYVRELNWNDDFSYHAKYIAKDAIEGINKLWENDPKCFIIKSNIVIITLGTDKGSRKMLESWANSLPVEFEASYSEKMNMSQITINRLKLEEALDHKLNNFGKLFRR